MPNPTAFTVKAKGGILKVIQTPITIHLPGSNKKMNVTGIWDTGATGTTITKNVAAALGLIASGKAWCHTANGKALQNTYTIDASFPTGVKIEGIICSEVDALSGGCEALIGMDIITLGDFSITNHNGITCMSFRLPSSHEIESVHQLQNLYFALRREEIEINLVELTHA